MSMTSAATIDPRMNGDPNLPFFAERLGLGGVGSVDLTLSKSVAVAPAVVQNTMHRWLSTYMGQSPPADDAIPYCFV